MKFTTFLIEFPEISLFSPIFYAKFPDFSFRFLGHELLRSQMTVLAFQKNVHSSFCPIIEPPGHFFSLISLIYQAAQKAYTSNSEKNVGYSQK